MLKNEPGWFFGQPGAIQVIFSQGLHQDFTERAQAVCVNRLRDKWLLAPHALGLAVFFACQGVGQVFPEAKIKLFCWPAAIVSALFLGVPVTDGYGNEPILEHKLLDVQVAESCSGVDFFSLLLAVFCGLAVRYGVRSPLHWAILLSLAFPISVAANAARIVSAVQIRVFAQSQAIAFSNDIAHFAVGAAVFTVVLTACCYAARSLYEYNSHRTSYR